MGKLIYQRWAFSIILIITFILVFTGVTVYLNSNVYDDSKKITHKDLPLTINALSMIDKFNNMSYNLLEYSHGELEEKKVFFTNLEEYNKHFSELKELNKVYNLNLPVNRLLRVSEDYINSANRVFLLYNPKVEFWAISEINNIEYGIEKKLKDYLENIRKSSNISKTQNIILLELINKIADMHSSLVKYVSGEINQIDKYETHSKKFNSFVSKLKNTKFKTNELKEIIQLQNILYTKSYNIFDTYNPKDKQKALKLIDFMEHNQFKELENILNILAGNSINNKERIMGSIEASLSTANYITLTLAILTIVLSIFILKSLYKNFTHKMKHINNKQTDLEKSLDKKVKELNRLQAKLNSSSNNNNKNIFFKKAKVLIADDIQDNIDLITSYYEDKNLEFIEALNGQEAVELAKKKKPDLILMDLKMPIMDGYEACELIRDNQQISHIPIIAISSSVLDRNILLLEKDFNGYISRPIDFSLLEKELIKYLK